MPTAADVQDREPEGGRRATGGTGADAGDAGDAGDGGGGPQATATLEDRVSTVGRRLAESIGEIVRAVPGAPSGPQALAVELGLDKVLASRMLKALRAGDPMAVVHHAPGPDPMRRLVKAAGRRGVPVPAVERAHEAIDAFESLIRRDAGDRSALDAIISAWLPEARREFELRRKQAMYRATSQLKGSSAETSIAAVFLHPAEDGERLDVVWVFGYLGLHRLRPGTSVKCATRRIAPAEAPRRPLTLAGTRSDDLAAYRLDAFCNAPPARMERRELGETVHYVLAGDDFGPRSAVDFLIAEVNLAEMPRFVPAGSGRRGYVFAETATPSKRLLFDAWVHEDVYEGRDPQLVLHDTAYEGVADLNDPAREADRLDLLETVRPLGRGIAAARDAGAPRHADLLRHVFSSLGWNDAAFRGYRTVIDYPVHGAQTSMAWEPPTR